VLNDTGKGVFGIRRRGGGVHHIAGGSALRVRVFARGAGVLGVLCATLGALGSTPALATSVVEQDLPTLCREAEMAFVGTVTGVSSRWVDAKQTRMETLVTFAHILPLLADPGAEVTLRFPGGEIDGMIEHVAGLPCFRVGDRAVLLIGGEGRISPIVGFYQGFFPVADGPEGPIVLNVGQRLTLSGSGGSVDTDSRDGSQNESISLETFLDVLRAEFDRKQEGR
jgi:hypothetical protein